MTRLESGKLQLQRQRQVVEELVGTLAREQKLLALHPLSVSLPAVLLLI